MHWTVLSVSKVPSITPTDSISTICNAINVTVNVVKRLKFFKIFPYFVYLYKKVIYLSNHRLKFYLVITAFIENKINMNMYFLPTKYPRPWDIFVHPAQPDNYNLHSQINQFIEKPFIKY